MFNDALSNNNDVFDEEILELGIFKIDYNIEGLIAIFYRNLWAMAELREKLMQYENIGLEPEQIKEIDKLYRIKCEELARYKKLKDKGFLLKMPCVGDTVYRINLIQQKCIPMKVFQICFSQMYDRKTFRVNCRDNADFGQYQYMEEDFNKKVFFSLEEAKHRLAEICEN